MSYRDQPELVEAVRSLLEQSEPVEIVVVNSGGGDPARRLREAGMAVPVINRAERLYPGAARNLGIAATNAAYVGFLAADCAAARGWAAARLRRHRAGADAVSGALANAFPNSRSACAQHLLLHHRRMPGALERERLLYSLSYDRALFDRFGRFREDLRQCEDTDLNSRLSGSCTVVWESHAVATHRYPARPAGLLQDQFHRGRRHAAASQLGLEGWRGRRGVWIAVLRLCEAVAHALRMDDTDGRRTLRRAAPLLVPALIAYGFGTALERGLRPASMRAPSGAVRGAVPSLSRR